MGETGSMNRTHIKEQPIDVKKLFLGRIMTTLEGYVQIDLKKMGCKRMDWSHLMQDGVKWWDIVNTVKTLSVP
jgi:hypothetical protein